MLAAGNPTHLQQHAMPVSSATAFGHGVVPFVMPGWEGRRHGGNHHLVFLNTSPRVGGPRHSGRGYVSEQCASARMQCADIQRQSAAWYVSFSMLSPHRACLCILWRGGGIGPHVCDDRNCELVNVTILFCEEQIGTFKRVIYIIGTISVHGPRSPKS